SDVAGITCGADCNEAYLVGTRVTLVATPRAGSIFVGWTGCDVSFSNRCVVTVGEDRTVTARFVGLPPRITVILLRVVFLIRLLSGCLEDRPAMEGPASAGPDKGG